MAGRAKLAYMSSMNFPAGQQVKYRPTQEDYFLQATVLQWPSQCLIYCRTGAARILLFPRLFPQGRVGAFDSAGAFGPQNHDNFLDVCGPPRVPPPPLLLATYRSAYFEPAQTGIVPPPRDFQNLS